MEECSSDSEIPLSTIKAHEEEFVSSKIIFSIERQKNDIINNT